MRCPWHSFLVKVAVVALGARPKDSAMKSVTLNKIGVRLVAMTLSIIIATATVVESAKAACAEMWATRFTGAQPTRCPPGQNTCTDGSDTRPAVFHGGDQFTLCVKLLYNAYITLWDAAPNGGNVHRIYPNFLSHLNNASVLGEKLAGGSEHCFGYRDFPLYFPKAQGLGQGRLTIFATPSLDEQPTPRDMKVPGQEMERPRHEMIARTLNAANDCHMPYSHFVTYRVVE
jgi:hypothetical protein